MIVYHTSTIIHHDKHIEDSRNMIIPQWIQQIKKPVAHHTDIIINGRNSNISNGLNTNGWTNSTKSRMSTIIQSPILSHLVNSEFESSVFIVVFGCLCVSLPLPLLLSSSLSPKMSLSSSWIDSNKYKLSTKKNEALKQTFLINSVGWYSI